MKKIIKEFSDFINQGNLVEIAVGLLLATAFKDVVTAFSDSFIMPIVNGLLGFSKDTSASIVVFDMRFTYGDFISTLISFLIIAFVLFMIAKTYNRIKALAHLEEETSSVENELSVLKEIKELLEKKEDTK